MAYLGDFTLGETLDFRFTTVGTTGAPTTLAGTPVVSAYVGNSTTQITAGITLSVDFDGVTGLHNVRVVASGANGYAAQTNVDLVITTGTVGGTSVVGYVVGSFSIENRSTQSLATAANLAVVADYLDTEIAAIKAKTDNLPPAPASTADCTTALTTALTEGYRADGATGSVAQLLYETVAHLGESSIVSTTKTIKKVDGSTTAATFTLNDATTPTSITRAT